MILHIEHHQVLQKLLLALLVPTGAQFSHVRDCTQVPSYLLAPTGALIVIVFYDTYQRKNLVIVSNPEIYKTKIPFSLETRDLEKNILDLVSNHEIQRDKNLDLVSKNPYISMYSFNNNLETGSNVLTHSIHSKPKSICAI